MEGIFFSSMKNVPIRTRNIALGILLFLQLFIPAGLRHVDVYNDSIHYADHFADIFPKSIFDINLFDRFEYGYQVLENFVFLHICRKPVALFFVTSLIIQSSYIILFARYSKSLWFTVFLYVGLTHYFFVVSGIRQALAISVFNFAIPLLFRRKWVSYMLIVILSAQLHSSAYILLLLPLLYIVKLTKKSLFIYILAIAASFFFLQGILDAFFSLSGNYGTDYLERISESKTGVILILITYLFGLFSILQSFNFKNHTQTEKMTFMFYLALIMFLVLSIKMSILVRFTHFFIPISIVMLANSVYKMKNVINRFIVYTFWVLFLLSQIYIILTYRPEWFMITPYKFYWEP